MFPPLLRFALAALVLVFLQPHTACAQAVETAGRSADFTGFAGITGIYTGLSNGKNQAVTAGLDFNFPYVGRVRPSLGVRATVPIDRGLVDNQKSLLAGPRVELYLGRVHPYVDFLVGRGQINYPRPYYDYNGRPLYWQPRSTVVSPGIGVRFDLARNLAAVADVQMQRWDTPASLSGHLFAKPFTAGLVYRFSSFSKVPRR